MLMSVLIITEDSAIKQPQIDKWKNTIRKGQDIEKDNELILLLNTNNLQIPSDDLGNEAVYRTTLKKYLRPAKFMFSGMFSEVRAFSNQLATLTPTDLFIISGRYGIVNQDDFVIPYSKNVKTVAELRILNTNTGFVHKIQDLMTQSPVTIFLLPSEYVKFFLLQGVFDSIPRDRSIIVVTNAQNAAILDGYPNFIILPRKGVARLGYKNWEKILHIVKQHQKQHSV